MNDPGSDGIPVTLGEVARSIIRVERAVERLALQMQVALSPVSAHEALIDQINTHLSSADTRIVALDKRVTDVQVKAGYIAGIISMVGAVLSYIMGKH